MKKLPKQIYPYSTTCGFSPSHLESIQRWLCECESVCVVCDPEFMNQLTPLLFDTSGTIYKNLKDCKT